MRWLKRKQDYFVALQNSINFLPSPNLHETIERYIAHRIQSISVMPLFTFTEYACNLQLPDFVFENKAMTIIERVGVELQMLANDCVSYHRERALGCEHNIVHWYLHHGLSEQAAYDKIHTLMRDRYRSWYRAQAELPLWGENLDQQVQRYIKGIQDVALANAHWSFRSERYFGKHREEVRRTRRIVVDSSDWLESVVAKPNAEVGTERAGFEKHIEQPIAVA